MLFTIGQVPDQPGINGSKSKLLAFCKLSCPFHIVQDPFNLGSREVRIDQQTSFLLNHVQVSILDQLSTIVSSSSILPYDCIIDRFSSPTVPNHGGFPLVGDPDSFDGFQLGLGFRQSFSENRHLARPSLLRIMYYPSKI